LTGYLGSPPEDAGLHASLVRGDRLTFDAATQREKRRDLVPGVMNVSCSVGTDARQAAKPHCRAKAGD